MVTLTEFENKRFLEFAIIRYFKNTTFRKLLLFPSSGEVVGITYSVGSVGNSEPTVTGQIFVTDPAE
jgi:uncharacterized membrane protein